MVESPGLEIVAEPAEDWGAEGPSAARAERVARDVARSLAERGHEAAPLRFTVLRLPPEHVGLGTGTQLSLAVARLVAESAGVGPTPAPELAAMTGRGVRSGVGLHGFDLGGLVVEGGHKGDAGIAPVLCRMAFPEDWWALVVAPPHAEGLHGPEEREAFAALPPMPESETDRLCRLVLLGVLPAVAERDLGDFGVALEETQFRVGSWFAPAQGGVFASPRLTEMVGWLRARGLKGVGQSSWGPTLYGFTDEGPDWRDALLTDLRERFTLGDAGVWTVASRSGAV